MKTFAFFARTQQNTTQAKPVRSGPTLIDPKDFKHIGGGSPRGTWLSSSTSTDAASTLSPRGTW